MGEKHSKKTHGPGPGNGRETLERGSPELREQIAALAEQVRRLSARGPAPPPVPPAGPPPAAPVRTASEHSQPRGELLASDVIAMTERAAAQIRESARREAERIRAQSRSSGSVTAARLAGIVRRQRAALTALAAEIELLEQGAEALRAQLALLEGELAQIDEILGTSGPPELGAFSAPAA